MRRPRGGGRPGDPGERREFTTMNRRQFLKSTAATGAGILFLPSGIVRGVAPSEKLNLALIGVWGRGLSHRGGASRENVVALCDVDENHLGEASKKFPLAKMYVDWRKCLAQDDVDAVICCTTDFTHAFVANWAMERGLHIYCEKPLGNTVEEARLVRATYLK
ncbi:MAG: Gfo/Idh/MocA family oxidoreductase, partial [Planctomycetes bacterium]|nr:Gfo/Idh/MocA family oxidoreductase [Planctomycetota bacterium]